VRQLEARRVERLPREAQAGAIVVGQLVTGEAVEDPLVRAVDLVPDERQPGVVEVGSDLVLAAGARAAGEERDGRAVAAARCPSTSNSVTDGRPRADVHPQPDRQAPVSAAARPR
jgi:hypothetical protein